MIKKFFKARFVLVTFLFAMIVVSPTQTAEAESCASATQSVAEAMVHVAEVCSLHGPNSIQCQVEVEEAERLVEAAVECCPVV